MLWKGGPPARPLSFRFVTRRNDGEWLALEVDFRTPEIGQIVAGLPQFDLIVHSQLADLAH